MWLYFLWTGSKKQLCIHLVCKDILQGCQGWKHKRSVGLTQTDTVTKLIYGCVQHMYTKENDTSHTFTYLLLKKIKKISKNNINKYTKLKTFSFFLNMTWIFVVVQIALSSQKFQRCSSETVTQHDTKEAHNNKNAFSLARMRKP